MATSGGWTALVVGGTGAIGKYVVAEILKNEKFAAVTAANSFLLYPKTKGEIEDFLPNLNFKQYSIFRAGLLDRGTEARTIEKFLKAVLSSQKVHDVARAMVRQAELVLQTGSKGEELIGPKDIKKLYEKDTISIPQ